jgi:hypothetical protein
VTLAAGQRICQAGQHWRPGPDEHRQLFVRLPAGPPLTRQPDELLLGAIGVEHPLEEVFMPEVGFTLLARAGTSGGHHSNVTVHPNY